MVQCYLPFGEVVVMGCYHHLERSSKDELDCSLFVEADWMDLGLYSGHHAQR
jgi:hypothetical protein